MARALIIMAHGSRNAGANREFSDTVRHIAERMDGYDRVEPAFLELAQPSLMEVSETLHREGITQLDVYPMFFNRGKHVARDIPEQVESVRATHPGMTVALLDYFGASEALPRAMMEHIRGQRQ
jgi:sirohydrochlorin cobaltochelatase